MSNTEIVNIALKKYPIAADMVHVGGRNWTIHIRWEDGYGEEALTVPWLQPASESADKPSLAKVVDTLVGDRHSFVEDEWDVDFAGSEEQLKELELQVKATEAFFGDRLDVFTYGD